MSRSCDISTRVMPLIQKFSVITILLVFFSALCISMDELGEMKQDRKTCIKVISWRLKNVSVTFNTSGVLQKGDGDKQNVQTENIKTVTVNETTVIKVCCPGYSENEKGKCKKCKRGWYGENCMDECNCKKKRKCDRVTGECKKCKKQPCEDELTNETDATPRITTVSTTPLQLSTRSRSTVKSYQTTVINNTTEPAPAPGICNICIAANNCTEQQKCNGLTAGRGDAANTNEDTDSTILIAVILSLGTCTILLLVGIVFRERYHKFRKRRQRDEVKFSDDAEYVDPEPIYFEIKDDDVICNGHGGQNKSHSDMPKASNDYQLSEIPNRSESSESTKDNVDEDECGYLNPYTPLRFARSETNLYRDKKIHKQGEYDVTYSTAKSIPVDPNPNAEDIDKIDDDNEKLDQSSQNQKLLTDGPVYFVLEKVQKEADTSDIEREKLLSRSSRSSI